MLNGFSSSSRPYSRVRPSLYQRSERRWLPAYSLANSQVSGSPLTLTRSGVEPADPDRPNGLISATWTPAGPQGPVDGLAAAAADVQVGGAAAVVGDGEHLVGGDHAERHQGDGDPDDDGDEHVAGRVHGQVDERHRQGRDQGGDHRLAEPAQPPGGGQRVEHAHQERGQGGDRARGVGVAAPVAEDLDAERAGPHVEVGEQAGEGGHGQGGAEEHEQVPEAAQGDQGHHRRPEQDPARPARGRAPPA